MRISRLLQISVVLVILSGSVMAWQIAGGHRSTDWELQPSLKYDSLCLLNVLSGDPYYMTYYKAEFEHFNPLFTAPERTSFQKLKTILKDESGGIISATL